MTEKESESCIGTIEMLRRLAYNIHGVMDVIDADNCEKIIKVLSDIPKYKDAYNKGWDDGAKATYEHLKMCEEAQETTGHWKRISMDKYSEHAKYWYRCDKCGKDNLGNTDWCPSCGARMESENV